MAFADPAQLGALIPIVAIVVGGAIAIFAPLARAHARQLDKQGVGMTPEIGTRLERMEQSIEAIALEIERISEGQRFTTKLLADRSDAAGAHSPGVALPAGERRE